MDEYTLLCANEQAQLTDFAAQMIKFARELGMGELWERDLLVLYASLHPTHPTLN